MSRDYLSAGVLFIWMIGHVYVTWTNVLNYASLPKNLHVTRIGLEPQITQMGVLQMSKGWSSWERAEINVLIQPQTLQLDDLLEQPEAQESAAGLIDSANNEKRNV